MEKLLQLSDELGLHIIEAGGTHAGGYRPGENVIRLRPGMSRRATRTVLAHEIGHHLLGHRPTHFGPVLARQERSANEWAARELIPIAAYREAEYLRDGHVPSIAFELDVLPVIVESYQSILERHLRMAA